jgi:hypothetical protein
MSEASQTTLAGGIGTVQARSLDDAIASAGPVAQLPGESNEAYAARKAGKADLQAKLKVAYGNSAPPDPTKQISTAQTSAFTSAEADRALAHYNETGLSPAVQADLRKNGLSPVSQVEKDAARQFLEGVHRDPAKLKAFAEGTDLVLNGRISSASLLLASPLGNFSEAELQSRMRAIAALKG